MNPTETIKAVQGYLDAQLVEPVRTPSGLEDSRPVPVIVLDDFSITDITFHNTHLAQTVENDAAGVSDEKYFRFHYWIRLDFTIRDVDDLAASTLHSSLRAALTPIAEDPRSLDDDFSDAELRGGGGFRQTRVEDSESETTQAFRIRTFEQVLKDSYDSLDDLQKEFNTTDITN